MEERIEIKPLETTSPEDIKDKINEICTFLNCLNLTVRSVGIRNTVRKMFLDPTIEEGIDMVNNLLEYPITVPKNIKPKKKKEKPRNI